MLSLFSIIIFSFPSFATDPDIAANVTTPSCNSGVLDTDSGSVDLEIQWAPNTINVKWYNDTEENGATTPSTTNTCTYDGALTVPAAPAKKTGYTFAGWKIRDVLCSFANLDSSAFGTLPVNGEQMAYIQGAGVSAGNISKFGLTERMTFGVLLGNNVDKIIGTAYCSAKSGDNHNNTWSGNTSDWQATENELISAGNGIHCWCKITQYTVNEGHSCQRGTSPWIFYTSNLNTGNRCLDECASSCAYRLLYWSGFLHALFGISSS